MIRCLLQDGDRFLLAARKRKKNKSANYVISSSGDDLSRGRSELSVTFSHYCTVFLLFVAVQWELCRQGSVKFSGNGVYNLRQRL